MLRRPLKTLSQSFLSWNSIVKEQAVLEMARQRVFVMGGLVSLAFLAVGVRLFDVMVLNNNNGQLPKIKTQGFQVVRGNLTDRNGEILATNIVTASLYANPKVIIDAESAAKKLASVLPAQKYGVILKRLKSGKGFVWIDRHIAPKTQYAINQLGIPGVYLYRDQRRVYTHGSLASHVLGVCGMDGNGLSGVEKHFDADIRQKDGHVQLSMDLRIQHIVKEELEKSVQKFSAVGGNAIVMNLKTGEVLSMVSLPDFDPNAPIASNVKAMFNRNTSGAYEPGSTFKVFNVAIALETGKATLQSVYDATKPIKIGRFKVSDFRGKKRPLTLKEAFIYSSNVASVKISQEFGAKVQKKYMKKFGALDRINLEIPENANPIVPRQWADTTSMTISYGYGISVTPLQQITMIASIINNGHRVEPTLIKRHDITYDSKNNEKIVSTKTSKTIRDLMSLVVQKGTARTANVQGFDVIAKTGTAYQSKGKSGYGKTKSRTTTAVFAFPKDNPKYIGMVMLDDPKSTKETHGFATAGWNAAPLAGDIVTRIGPMLMSPIEGKGESTTLGELINTGYIQNLRGYDE